MARMLIAVQTRSTDGENYFVGSVETPDGFNSDNPKARLENLWAQWREETPEPENDSEFIHWLIETQGFEHGGLDDVVTIDV